MIVLLYVVVILFAWFLQNMTHELSHLLVGKIVEGRKIIKIVPWPHKHNGSFYFARCEYGPATKKGSPKFRHAAPLMGCAVIFLIGVILSISTWKLFMLAFVICPIVDCCVWVYGYIFNRPLTDGFRFKNNLQ